MTKLVLSYNLPAKKAAKIRMIATRLGAKVRAVEKTEQQQKLAFFLENYDTDVAAPFASPFDAEMLVFAFFSQPELDVFLQQLRVQKIPISLKAVLTQTNQDWTSAELYAQLCAERDAIAVGIQLHSTE